jgi:hypothetical protein
MFKNFVNIYVLIKRKSFFFFITNNPYSNKILYKIYIIHLEFILNFYLKLLDFLKIGANNKKIVDINNYNYFSFEIDINIIIVI